MKNARILIVVVLTAIVVAYTVPDIVLPWFPWANYGMTVSLTGERTATVRSVDPNGPAAKAGIHGGDTIDLTAMSLADRVAARRPYNAARAGARATFEIVRGRRLEPVTLAAVPHPRTLADNIADLLQVSSQAAFPIIAAILVLLRPNALTWAFFLYGLTTSVGALISVVYVPLPIAMLELAWNGVAGDAGAVAIIGTAAFIVFALRFPSNVIHGWKARAERIVLFLSVPALMASIYVNIGSWWFAPGSFALAKVLAWVVVAGACFGALAFIATVVSATPQERPRVMWVVIGFIIGYGGFRIGQLLHYVLYNDPIWLNDALFTLNVLVPITVTYAILKHRVIDVRFFLNRALVYGILTTVGVGLLALLDWAVAMRLATFGIIVEAAGALALGIAIQKLHGNIDALVDRYVFRSMHEAEKHLQRVADAMMYAPSLAAVDALLVAESAHALALSSAAVFRRTARSFERESAVGWSDLEARELGLDDPLVLDLQAQRAGIRGGRFLTERSDLPLGAAAPALAVPICVREQMTGFVLFGAHLNASDIDPNEEQILSDFVKRAATAYDHVWSVERAAENDRMRIELDFVRGVLKGVPSLETPS